MRTDIRYRVVETITGLFALIDDGASLRTTWVDGPDDAQLRGATADPVLRPDLVERLDAYFAGRTVDFHDVPTPRGPAFFRCCWEACRSIPPGRTASYSRLAEMAGSPGAARAAGQAMRHNPLPVIVPCHRVLAAGGRIGGFGGSRDPDSVELRRKRRLLELEQPSSRRVPEGRLFASP